MHGPGTNNTEEAARLDAGGSGCFPTLFGLAIILLVLNFAFGLSPREAWDKLYAANRGAFDAVTGIFGAGDPYGHYNDSSCEQIAGNNDRAQNMAQQIAEDVNSPDAPEDEVRDEAERVIAHNCRATRNHAYKPHHDAYEVVAEKYRS